MRVSASPASSAATRDRPRCRTGSSAARFTAVCQATRAARAARSVARTAATPLPRAAGSACCRRTAAAYSPWAASQSAGWARNRGVSRAG
ncbi:hypothetical protein [Streptomyces sp. B93]|uniref:hypothetical protein n=1 Tax=Streptomyces sp. B93 TaxID=2824875 RepID=UPI001B3965AD|nr:hypothetical protein [Streptomyces sp. B93]MBQ1091620.1 hypothetical protein [Streptomyces sp. B93]